MKAVEQDAHELVGREFNLGSPKQLQEILFDQFGLPKTKRIKTGYTTDADSLADLYVQTEHPVLELLLRHREVARLKSVVDGLLPLIDDHGRIHTTFNQTDRRDRPAVVHRPEPAEHPGAHRRRPPHPRGVHRRRGLRVADDRRLQPDRDADHGAPVRRRRADRGVHLRRGPAHLRRVAGLRPAAGAGRPPSCAAGSRRCPTAWRTGCRAFGLSQQLKITPDEAREQMDAYFTRFGGVRDYLRSVVEEARQTGYTETIMGRRRYLDNLNSDNRNLREMAERAALNAPIQGSAADIIKVAMLGVHRGLAEAGLRVPAAAAGARRAGARDRRRGARRGRGAGPRARWAAPTRSTCRSTSRSASAAPGTTPRTDPHSALFHRLTGLRASDAT